MVVDERMWRCAVEALENLVGPDEASALIAEFRDRSASRADLAESVDRLDARITQVEERMMDRMALHAAEITAAMRGELNAQVRSMMFGFVGLQVTIGSFVIALFQFAR